MNESNEKWMIEACFCYAIAGRKPSGEPLVQLPSGYGFWRLTKEIESNEKQFSSGKETVEAFYGLLIDQKNGHNFFVTYPSKWRVYQDWHLCCLTGENLITHNAVVSPANTTVITEGSKTEMFALWNTAKIQIDSLNGQMQNCYYGRLGMLRRDSILPHNTVFRLLGELMGLKMPNWSKSQPGIKGRLVDILLKTYGLLPLNDKLSQDDLLYLEKKGPIESNSPVSPIEQVSMSPKSFL